MGELHFHEFRDRAKHLRNRTRSHFASQFGMTHRFRANIADSIDGIAIKSCKRPRSGRS
jgi:hypothetical protein